MFCLKEGGLKQRLEKWGTNFDVSNIIFQGHDDDPRAPPL